MNLVEIYEEYKDLNKGYIYYLNELVEKDLSQCSGDVIIETLTEYQNKFEELKLKSDDEVVDEENKNNLNDLKYLIVDTLFLSLDLLTFYNYKEFERFKMRAVNYINKRGRAEMLQ